MGLWKCIALRTVPDKWCSKSSRVRYYYYANPHPLLTGTHQMMKKFVYPSLSSLPNLSLSSQSTVFSHTLATPIRPLRFASKALHMTILPLPKSYSILLSNGFWNVGTTLLLGLDFLPRNIYPRTWVDCCSCSRFSWFREKQFFPWDYPSVNHIKAACSQSSHILPTQSKGPGLHSDICLMTWGSLITPLWTVKIIFLPWQQVS